MPVGVQRPVGKAELRVCGGPGLHAPGTLSPLLAESGPVGRTPQWGLPGVQCTLAAPPLGAPQAHWSGAVPGREEKQGILPSTEHWSPAHLDFDD